MRRVGIGFLCLVAAIVVLPPLWYTLFPGDPPPELLPAGQRIALPSGVALNVVEAGQGDPVVLIHGLPGSAYDWRAVLPELAARGRRAIAYDRVGYGRSDPRSDDRYTVAANADELLALLEAMDLRDATVVGWSYGGVTAMTGAMRDSERIGKLVLVGTAGPNSADSEPPAPGTLMKLYYSGAAMRWRGAVPPIGVGTMKLLSGVAFSGAEQPVWWLEGLRANFRRWETRLAYAGEMTHLASEDAGAFDLAAISQATLLLHGDDDQLAGVGTARYLVSVIENSQLHEYPGGSHMLPVTHAKDLAERIAAF
jgi:pimeloyl-ACP methyl ester carboxylesterase